MAEEIHTTTDERGVDTVALMRGDELLSRTLVVPMTMRIGRAVVRMDGIGGVATPEEHRYKGYSRRVLEAAVAHMLAGDAVLTTLYGIPHYYPKFGYATLGPEYALELRALGERDALPDGITERNGRPGDLSALQRLYRTETSQAYGPLVRDDEWWVWERLAAALEPQAGEVRVVERGSQIVGYAWRGRTFWWMEHIARDAEPALRIAEVFATDAAAANAVLAMCRRWASSTGETRCELAIPPESRVARAAMFQNTSHTARYLDEAEFMGRATGLVALLRALEPELRARWQPHTGTDPGFALTITSGAERATITGDEAGIAIEARGADDTILHLDPGTVGRLATGGFPPETVLEAAGVPASTWPVLATLFPQHVPYIYPADRF